MKSDLKGTKYENATVEKPVVYDLKKKVKLQATATAPHHKEGDDIVVSDLLAAKMLNRGWAIVKKEKTNLI